MPKNLPKTILRSINGTWWLCLGENQINTHHSSSRKGGYTQKQLRQMCPDLLTELEATLRKEGTQSPWENPPTVGNHRSPFGMGA